MIQKDEDSSVTTQSKTEIAAIYFPSWHPDEHYSAWFGPGWSEWELVKKAPPRFPGHYQPLEPTWGHFDESDPKWAARQIDLAAEYGVTAFMFDWYWYQGVKILHGALEKGFLQAPNREKLKFFLMWANHDWWNWPAMTGKPGMGQSPWLFSYHTTEDLGRVVDYCAQHYFCQPNYLHIDGKPVLCIYQPDVLMEQLAQAADLPGPLSLMNDQARRHGLSGIHFIANIGCLGGSPYSVYWDLIPKLADAGYDAVFPYNIVQNGTLSELPKERPAFPYEEIVNDHQYVWQQCENKGLPFYPSISMGFDHSPRWNTDMRLPIDNMIDLHYQPFVENCTPELFGRLCRMGLDHVRQNDSPSKLLFINAWNEWTEGMCLLPEKRYGTRYLEMLRSATM